VDANDDSELLEIAVSDSGDVRLVRLDGELDMAGVDRFQRSLAGERESQASTYVVDLRGLSFLDSSGLRALIVADQSVRDGGGRFIVIRGSERVNEVLEMTGVAQRIELVSEPPAL
jgi:anti-sigma B factor antagonist